jgi:hypothetical protein
MFTVGMGRRVPKRVNWAAEILWISTDTMGWRALGERSFEPGATG